MKSNNRVVFNTAVLYAKMLLTVGFSLYTTRLILDALGNVDFGIFNLIAGVIALLGFLNEAMATSTQRYLSLYQGKNDLPMQRIVFTQSLQLHFKIGGLIIIALLIAGNWLFNGFLVIPDSRLEAAKLAYYMMIFSVSTTILIVPFTGSLIAHENMVLVAAIGTLEIFLKLGLALALFWVKSDKLVAYSIGIAAINFISLFVYVSYCFRKYPECTLIGIFAKNKKLSKELSSFAGWNLFGALCGVGRTQGTAVIFNIFLGAVVNTSYAIANQVSAQMSFFSVSLLRAINPQIMKSEGLGDRERMLKLSMAASKYGFFLFAIFAIPCIFEMEAILGFWLKEVPVNAVAFCQLSLVTVMCNQITIGLQSAFQAIGQIKIYQLVVGSLILSGIPLSYAFLHFGFSAVNVLFIWILIELVACTLRIYLINRIAGPLIQQFLRKVLAKEIVPVLVSVIICIVISVSLSFDYRFLVTITTSCFAFLLSIYFFGSTTEEKVILTDGLKKVEYFFKNKIGAFNI
jgi:O-antigen/teichoic acid export membrane protein